MYEVIGRSMSTGAINHRCGIFDSYEEAQEVADWWAEENEDEERWYGVEDYLG